MPFRKQNMTFYWVFYFHITKFNKSGSFDSFYCKKGWISQNVITRKQFGVYLIEIPFWKQNICHSSVQGDRGGSGSRVRDACRMVVSIFGRKKFKIKLLLGTKFRLGVLNFIVIFHLVPGTYFENFETNFICIFQITSYLSAQMELHMAGIWFAEG